MNDIAPKPMKPGPIKRAPPREAMPIFPLVTAVIRGLLGVVCLGAALLYLPIHFSTPVLSGVSVLMCVTGANSCWRVGRQDERIRATARLFVWGIPICMCLVFVVMFIVGPGGFGPDWYSLAGKR